MGGIREEKEMNIDENAPEIEAGNIVNEILLAHREKWNGDDEIQDMLAEAFVMGVKYWQDKSREVIINSDRVYTTEHDRKVANDYKLQILDSLGLNEVKDNE